MAHYIDEFPGRELTIQGKKHLYFGGTSYLGLQTDEEFQNIFIGNIKKYGTNYGASRNSNIRLSVFEEAEKQLAEIVGCDAALTLSSGYLAGQFIAQHFSTPHYEFFYAPNTHSALYTDHNKPFTNFSDLNKAVHKHLSSSKNSIPVVFLDSIDFKGCNYPKFSGLQSLPLDKLILIVDDSHGIGIIGKNGEGAYNKLSEFRAKELIVCCSLGKSYAIQAGAVLGNTSRIQQLKKTTFFGGASPASPANIATFIESQTIYKTKRELLQENIGLFKTLVQNISFFSTVQGHPSFSFQDPHLTRFLEKNGIILSSFNYPEESASIISRIVISSHHTQGDLKLLARAVNIY
jgi:7-keto-8-aminopelargonate synthetase-like enzyme